uniref:(California timema) hypothetical protein n=1 Tax=Timema californicum TaxID=61474 RepID=A0A7R9J218_TIMCA|nr:unnamed protein product [Timema californicum]
MGQESTDSAGRYSRVATKDHPTDPPTDPPTAVLRAPPRSPRDRRQDPGCRRDQRSGNFYKSEIDGRRGLVPCTEAPSLVKTPVALGQAIGRPPGNPREHMKTLDKQVKLKRKHELQEYVEAQEASMEHRRAIFKSQCLGLCEAKRNMKVEIKRLKLEGENIKNTLGDVGNMLEYPIMDPDKDKENTPITHRLALQHARPAHRNNPHEPDNRSNCTKRRAHSNTQQQQPSPTPDL